MLDKIKEKIKNYKPKENTMKQNFWDFLACLYTPSLMLVVYYLVPEGKQTMERIVSYELWYVLVVILMFSFTIKPLFNFIDQYRNRNKYA